MEFDVFEVLLCHAQYVAAVGEENVAPLTVFGHILIFTLLEVVELSFVVALYPTCLVEVDRLPPALGIVFMLKAILDDLKLQLAYGADDAAVVELVDEKLGNALVHQLFDAL